MFQRGSTVKIILMLKIKKILFMLTDNGLFKPLCPLNRLTTNSKSCASELKLNCPLSFTST